MARQPFFGRGPGPQIARMDLQAATAPGRNWRGTFESIGRTVGDTLEKFRADKEKKKQQKILGDTVFNQFKDNPEALGATDEEELRAITKSLGKNPDALNFVTQLKRDAQTADMNRQIMEQRRMLIKSLRDKEKRELDLARFLTTGKDPELTRADFTSESIAQGEQGRAFDPDVRRGKKKLLPPSFYDPNSYERTPAPVALGLPERFQALLNSDLSPEAKAQGLAAIKAEQARGAELVDKMVFEQFKADLESGKTGPRDLSGSRIVNDAVARADKLISGLSTGYGAFLKGVPGTDAKALDSLFETIRANIGFDKLQAMREASPTGGALGQVSDRELKSLQAVFGNLDQAQSADQLRYNMKLLQHEYNNVVHGVGNHPFKRPGQDGEVAPDFSAMSESGKANLVEARRREVEEKTRQLDSRKPEVRDRKTIPMVTPDQADEYLRNR